MTYGFALLTVGTLFMYSGYTNNSIADVLKGLGKVRSHGAGDSGFIALLSGAGEAVKPGSGGSGPATSGKTPKGLTTFDGVSVCKWVAEELQWARDHGWNGSLISGYRSKQHQKEVCATGVTPCAKPGTSNHEGKRFPKCAADVTEPEQLDHVLSKKVGRRLHYTGKQIGDIPHFSSGLNGV